MTPTPSSYPDGRIDTPTEAETLEGLRPFDSQAVPAFVDDDRPTLPRVGDAGDRGRRA